MATEHWTNLELGDRVVLSAGHDTHLITVQQADGTVAHARLNPAEAFTIGCQLMGRGLHTAAKHALDELRAGLDVQPGRAEEP